MTAKWRLVNSGQEHEILFSFGEDSVVVLNIHADKTRMSGPQRYWCLNATVGTKDFIDGALYKEYDVKLSILEVKKKAEKDVGEWLRQEMMNLMMLIREIVR